VRFYCILHEIPVHQFVNMLLERELGNFRQKMDDMKKLRTEETWTTPSSNTKEKY
jgi:hypothetical protein